MFILKLSLLVICFDMGIWLIKPSIFLITLLTSMVTAKPYYNSLLKCFIKKTEKSEIKSFILPWIMNCTLSSFSGGSAFSVIISWSLQLRWTCFADIFKSSTCLRCIYIQYSPQHFQMFPENPGLTLWKTKV